MYNHQLPWQKGVKGSSNRRELLDRQISVSGKSSLSNEPNSQVRTGSNAVNHLGSCDRVTSNGGAAAGSAVPRSGSQLGPALSAKVMEPNSDFVRANNSRHELEAHFQQSTTETDRNRKNKGASNRFIPARLCASYKNNGRKCRSVCFTRNAAGFVRSLHFRVFLNHGPLR